VEAVAEVASIVLFSDQPDRTVGFYRAIGLELAGEDHGDGLVHSAAEVGSVHFAVFSASDGDNGTHGWRSSGSTFVGFYVESLNAAVEALRTLGSRVLEAHQVRPWGCRVVVEDPDGRAVEINQRNHCDDDVGAA
jgi:lactoylglutathione lyase